MARPYDKRDVLKDKHWVALDLIEEGSRPMHKVATESKVEYRTLIGLVAGDVNQCGKVAALFEVEYKKINKKKDARIDTLMKLSKELCLDQCSRIVRDLKKKSKLSKDDQNVIVKVTTAVGRVQPSVKIDKLQYQYTKGLTAEELISEFKRLGAVATGPSDSRSVQGAESRRSGTVSTPDERGSELDQGSKDNRLRADAKADDLPSEQL